MRSISNGCFTRVVVDGDKDLEVAELQAVMQRIRQSLQPIPEAQRLYVGNALLNLAVCRKIAEGGTERTATILIRLVDAVLEHRQHSCGADPFRSSDVGVVRRLETLAGHSLRALPKIGCPRSPIARRIRLSAAKQSNRRVSRLAGLAAARGGARGLRLRT